MVDGGNMAKIEVLDHQITVVKDDYISLTDIAHSKNSDEPKDVVKNWLRNKNTIKFLGLWEKINNPDFKGVEFDTFKTEAGLNRFSLSVKMWIQKTQADVVTFLVAHKEFKNLDAETDLDFCGVLND